MDVVARFFQESQKSYFLFGPRGTGKSTLIGQKYKSALVIDLLEPDTYRNYRAKPERIIDFIHANQHSQTIVIDEVQKVPELLSAVHMLIEENKQLQFILTGSSSRKLKQAGVNLLAGRAHHKNLHPFIAAEIADSFDLEQRLQFGMLPLVVSSKEPKNDLRAYLSLYMQQEVMLEGLVRKVDEFSRFLEVISFSQASTINMANIARECSISSNTINKYIQILEDLLLCFKVPIFVKQAKRNLISQDKFYYFDVGVYQSIRPRGILENESAIAGHALETLIAQHLRAWLEYSNQSGKLYYWHTKSGLEVDFVVYGEIGFQAIEVKTSNNLNPKDFRGLKEFHKDYPQAELIMVYGGKNKTIQNNILCLPIKDFLLSLIPKV